MGADPLIHRLFHLSLGCLGLYILMFIFLYSYLDRYRPGCYRGEKEEMEFAGPMRDAYVGQWVELLEENGLPYRRIGNEIFFRFVDTLGLSDITRSPFSYSDLQLNWEWRVATNIAYGYGPGDSRIEPPPILLELTERHRDHLNRKYPDPEDVQMRRNIFYENCELIRAAAIRIEDMPPGSLPHLPDSLPHSTNLPPQYR